MSLSELLMSFRLTTYEALLAMLHSNTLTEEQHERVSCELESRNRAMYNQQVQTCGGGELK